MKNVFILPTDKPSKLFIIDQSKMFISKPPYLSFSKVSGKVHKIEGSKLYQPQFIYVTNDEKIENKDYVLSSSSIGALYLDSIINTVHMLAEEQWKKVILTNDPKLISDGVQAIDDEFLEWLINNPSCEVVEVEGYNELGYAPGIGRTCFYHKYKITIPQEDRKIDNCYNFDEEIGCVHTDCKCEKIEHKGKSLTTEEVMEGRSSAYNFLDFKDSPEKETLEKIKFVLSANNEAQAIRLIEQYGEWVKENCRKEFEKLNNLNYVTIITRRNNFRKRF